MAAQNGSLILCHKRSTYDNFGQSWFVADFLYVS